MQIIQSGIPFTFSYGAYDQSASLYVAASIYDMTSGSPILVSLVPMNYVSFGVYSGNYNGNSNKTYLVILGVYTSNTYQTVDTSRSPSAECYQGVTRSLTVFPFNYATYDLDPSLYLQAKIYNTTSGLPTYVAAVTMQEVALGVYYGAFNAIALNNSYFVISSVYTDNTYAHVDSSRAPGNDVYQGSIFSELQIAQYGPNIMGVVDANNNNSYPYPSTPQLSLIQGETRNFVIRVVGPNFFPFDSTGLNEIQVRFLGYTGQPVILSLSAFYGGISVINLEQSLFALTLNSDETSQFQTGEQVNFTAYLYFGNFASGTYSGYWGNILFEAETPGTIGNVIIPFDGVSDIGTILEEFSDNNPGAPSITFSSMGDIQSQALLFFNYNAVDGQTLTITDSVSLNDIYTFRNTPVGSFDVGISSNLSVTIANLLASLNSHGSSNYNAQSGPNGNQILVFAGNNYLAAAGNSLSVSSSGGEITVTNFSGGTSTILSTYVPPMGSAVLVGGTDNTRIANFTRMLNCRFPSV